MNLLYEYVGRDQLPTPWASSRVILQVRVLNAAYFQHSRSNIVQCLWG